MKSWVWIVRVGAFALSLATSVAGLSGCNQSCEDGGRTYEDGDSWTCSDGCNSCGCKNGSISSTAKACLDADAGT